MNPSAEQTLNHLGIDRWVLRRAPGETSSGPAPGVPAVGAPAGGPPAARSATVPAELKAALAERTAPRGASGAPADRSSRARPAAGASEPGASDLPACKVLALGGVGALVLCFATRQSLSQRVARDLLLSIASTPPGSEPGLLERIFDWDPSALAAAQVSGRRALAAFAQRQLDDAGASSVLLTRDLADAVPELLGALKEAGARCLTVPTLEELAQDAEAKRQLWASLQTLKS